MTDMKSYADFVQGTLRAQLTDCAQMYPALAHEFDRDYLRLSSAINEHGVRFALDVMPAFRKHFDECLSKGRLTHSGLCQFGTLKGGIIPRLFRGLILRVFDGNGGLLIEPDIDAIRWIRQLLGVVRKLRLGSPIKAIVDSVDEFYQVDSEVRSPTLDWSSSAEFVIDSSVSFDSDEALPLLRPLSSDASHVHPCATLLQQVADLVVAQVGSYNPYDWHFRHGPGAVSDSKPNSYKYEFPSWSERLERVFPYSDFALANFGVQDLTSDVIVSYRFFCEESAKLIAVPKTLAKPRLIASEPTAAQWCQQSVRDFLYHRVESTIIGRFISFRDQTRNGDAALKASIDGSLSTIDLSSASDRVSCWSVERLFRRSPTLLDVLQSCRTRFIRQDFSRNSPSLYRLRKYTTMGNATTFPVQSLLFLVVGLTAYLHNAGKRATYKSLREIPRDQVRVFGDDIIVPTTCAGVTVELLEWLGLRVNDHKSFMEGFFRESCGVDAYGGHDVTTVNILDLPRRTGPGSIVSAISVHHNLCDRGYFATASFLQKTVEREIPYGIITVDHGSGFLGWSSLGGLGSTRAYRTRYNQDLHRREVRCLTLRALDARLPPQNSCGLLQYFTEAVKNVTSAFSTLGYATRRPKVRLGLGWVPASVAIL